MKFVILALAALSLLLTGCQSMSSAAGSVKERWGLRNNGRARIVPADQRSVFDASLAAVKKMGFNVTRSGAAQGKIDAVGGLQTDNSLRSSRQVTVKVRIDEKGDGCEVRLFLSEVIEDDYNKGAGMGTETPLADTPLYEVFFREVERGVQKKD